MPLKLPHSVFFHIAKTGGTWVRDVIRHMEIPSEEWYCDFHTDHKKCFHQGPLYYDCNDAFTFAFVRHPLSLYQSYWSFKMRNPHIRSAHDANVLKDTFEEYGWTVVEKFPDGIVSNTYKQFCGENLEQLSYIGRQESLTEDLITALSMAGEQFDPEFIRAFHPRNVSSCMPEFREQCQYSPELKAAVLQAEKWALDTFGYSDDILESQLVKTTGCRVAA